MRGREPEKRRRSRKKPKSSMKALGILITVALLIAGGVTTGVLLLAGGDDRDKKAAPPPRESPTAQVEDLPLESVPPQIAVFPNTRARDPLQLSAALQNVLATTDQLDPGWRLQDLEGQRKQLDPSENGAVYVHTAVKHLPQRWEPQPDGGIKTKWRNFNLPDHPSEVAFSRKRLEKVSKALVVARKLKDAPEGRFRISYMADGLSTPMEHLQEVRKVGGLLGLDAAIAVEEGDAEKAVLSCRACLNTGRTIATEPATISQLVNIAVNAIALQTLERALTLHKGPSAESLLTMQRLLEEAGNVPHFTQICRGERALFHYALTNVANGDLGMGPNMTRTTRGLLVGADNHAEYLRIMNEAVSASRQRPDTRSRMVGDLGRQMQQAPPSIKPILPKLDSVLSSCQRIQAQLQCASLALAAERYRLRNGRWPENLNTLVLEYISTLPIDPFHGRYYHYAILNDDVAIFCEPGGYEENPRTVLFEDINGETYRQQGFRLLSPARRRR